MRYPQFWAATFLSLPLALVTSCTNASDVPVGANAAADRAVLDDVPRHEVIDACSHARPERGQMRCHAKVRVDAGGQVLKESAPSGLGPADLRSAYKLPASGGKGKIVAVVDAFDSPNAESELAVYRSTFGQPPCTSANGCFKKVGQSGSTTNLPPLDSGWAGEIALDIQMVSAVCPDCKILLVEANSASESDLGEAVNTAAKLGASAISNSYGGEEESGDSQAYNHPGILVTASSGDSGYGAQFPATSDFVVAVGGTSLVRSSSPRGWAEGAWSGGGSGCSVAISKPAWQSDRGCSMRSEVDVSAVADPDTGVAVYTAGSWGVWGGTSAASPIVAAAFTLLGVSSDPSYAWKHPSEFYDVTTGSNGFCGSYLCQAGPGYDGPTGIGTPNGAALSGGGGGGSGSSSGGSGSGSGSGSGGGGGGSCTHDVCTSGAPLSASCGACEAKLCAFDSRCCQTTWDFICVAEVPAFCGQTCP
jgi:hypothetical protein